MWNGNWDTLTKTATDSCRWWIQTQSASSHAIEDHRRVMACNLLLSMLQNFGLELDRFGTSTGTLNGLEWS